MNNVGRLGSVLLVTVLASLPIACEQAHDSIDFVLPGGGGSSEPTALPMQRKESCERTVCEKRRADCYDEASDATYVCQIPCSSQSCYSDCAAAHPTDGCNAACEDFGECGERSFEFIRPSPADAVLYESCKQAVLRDLRCNEQTVYPICDAVAAVERPTNTSIYDCIAATACGGDAIACENAIVPGTLGDEIGAASAQLGWEIDDATRSSLNGNEGWWRDDVTAALRSCADATSGVELNACVEAWIVAVWPK